MTTTAVTSFSEARRNLTAIAERVASEGVEYTVFKRSKPLFKIVPISVEQKRNAATEARARAGARATGGTGSSSVPDGGIELYEYAMRLRGRMPQGTDLSRMTPQDMKREWEERDV